MNTLKVSALNKFHADRQEQRFKDLLEDRLTKIEEAIFTGKRSPASLPQQMLLLHETGMLKKLQENDISGVKLAKFLSVLLDADTTNIRKALSDIHKKDSYLKTSNNYAFLQKLYEDVGFSELARNADREFTRLSDEESKSKKRKI